MRFKCYCDSRYLPYLYFVLFINIFNVKVKSQTCTTFKNAVIQFKDINGAFFNKTIYGCIERIKFDKGEMVTEALVRKQDDLVRLGKDAVRNMAQLSRLSFLGCNYFEIIEVGCFRNVPALKKLQITFCKIRHIPKGVFNTIPQLEILRLNNNIMESIEEEAFSDIPSLKRIYAGHNNLKTWNEKWFLNSRAMEIIDFQYNKIQAIPSKGFSQFKKLKEIYFENNLIESLGSGMFDELEQLAYVDFSYNKIKEINSDIFPMGLKISVLNIHQNLLNFIPNLVMEKIKVSNISVHYNPWNCVCLEKIYQWIRKENITLYKVEDCFDVTIPECGVSKENPQDCEDHVDNELTERYYEHLEIIPKYVKKCRI